VSKRLVHVLVVSVALSLLLASPALAGPKTIEQRVAALETQMAQLQTQVTTLQTRVNGQAALIAALQKNPVLQLGPYVSLDKNTVNDVAGPNIFFKRANVHVLNGTAEPGFGNLIIGDNEGFVGAPEGYRSGSDNLVVGDGHWFSGSGCFVAGSHNIVSDYYASVSGGSSNTASAEASSVTGGRNNTASGTLSSVSGGAHNHASGVSTSVSGGSDNEASGDFASVSGGWDNETSGANASVSGGKSLIMDVMYGWAGGMYRWP